MSSSELRYIEEQFSSPLLMAGAASAKAWRPQISSQENIMAQRVDNNSKTHFKAIQTRDSRISCQSKKILYENGQWAVTDTGLEHLDGWAYHISKNTLLQPRGEDLGRAYQQPIHVGLKNSVDVCLFLDAYYRAIVLHGLEKDVDGLAMLRTFAVVIKAERRAWDRELRRQTGRLTREELGLDD
jgi:hypothetical protein